MLFQSAGMGSVHTFNDMEFRHQEAHSGRLFLDADLTGGRCLHPLVVWGWTVVLFHSNHFFIDQLE